MVVDRTDTHTLPLCFTRTLTHLPLCFTRTPPDREDGGPVLFLFGAGLPLGGGRLRGRRHSVLARGHARLAQRATAGLLVWLAISQMRGGVVRL